MKLFPYRQRLGFSILATHSRFVKYFFTGKDRNRECENERGERRKGGYQGRRWEVWGVYGGQNKIGMNNFKELRETGYLPLYQYPLHTDLSL